MSLFPIVRELHHFPRAISFFLTISQNVFQAVEDLCLHKFGRLVYDNLAVECQKQIYSEVDSLQEKVKGLYGNRNRKTLILVLMI